MKTTWSAVVAVAVAAATMGCGTQKIRFFMTDAPLDGATEVNVTLSGMKVFTSTGEACQDDESDAGVTEDDAKQTRRRDGDCGGSPDTIVFDEPRTYNLLSLRDGAQVLLGDVEVTGTVQHLQLKTDGTATVVYEDGSTRIARIPSGATSGLKIKGPFNSDVVLLDFDAAESIHESGTGELIFRPVIHAKADDAVVADSEPIE